MPAFAQCDLTTPSFIVDLSNNPDSIWLETNTARLDSCCFQQDDDPCITFIVTLPSNVGGLYFSVENPQPAISASQFHINCDTVAYSVQDTVCVAGYTPPYVITYCKPGNDRPDYIIAGIGSGEISPPITVSDACTDTIYGTGFKESTITWTSYPYNPVYQGYLSDTVAQDTVIVTPTGSYPDSLQYVICGELAGLNCSSGSVIKCDTTTVYFVTNFNVAISPQNPTICFGGGPVTLTANASGGAAPYTYLWSTGETTQSINVSSGNAGLYWVEVKDTLECAGVRDSVNVTEFTSSIAANAGSDLNSCANNPTVTLNGSIQAASGGIWSGGSGTFSPNDSALNADYTPGAAEISAGLAELLLITTGNGTCPADTDTVQINISPSPVADAGTNQTVCANEGIVTLAGSVSGGSASGQWTTSGSGTFSPNDSTLNATYDLSPSDISSGSITITLTSTNNGQCTPVSDSILVNITPLIVVNAGADQTVCANNSSTVLSGSVTGPTTTGMWTTSGGGSFSPNDSDLAATYQPSPADTAAGTVTIVLSSTNNGSCNAITDTMLLTITSIPQITAGPDLSACKNNPNTVLSGSISGGTFTGQWSTPGSGSFSPNDSDLAATYIPGSSDTSAGTVTVILTSTNNGGCIAVTDSMQISYTESPAADAGMDQSVCADAASISVNGSITIATGGTWTTTGGGNFSPDDSSLSATYVPVPADTAAGAIEIILTTTGNGNCNAVSDTMVVTITDAPAVDAGTDQAVCANNSAVALNGSVTVASGGVWTTSGSGSFSPDDSLLNATYLPSDPDTVSGSVVLVLTSTGNGSCNAVTDSMIVTITPAPKADAGTDIFVCKTNPDAVLNGSVMHATGGTWTTSGGGIFTPDANTLNATYVPDASDISNGNVTLTLTTAGNGSCNAVSDNVVITYTTDSVAVNAGNDTTVCSASFPLNGSVFIATGGTWTASGTGTFSPDDSTLNAVYAFSSSDTAAGTVTFVLTTTGNGGCASKSDTVVVSLAESISVNASAADSVCGNGDPVGITAVSSTSEGIWSTAGDGTFSPTDTALNAFYTPGTADITNGSATLIFATTNNNGCAPATDTVVINLVPAPFTDFAADSVCLNNPTSFNDFTTTVGTIVSWSWDFGDNNTSSAQNTSHQYSADGIYNVTLSTVSNYGCPDSITKQVIVFSLPDADFTSASQCFIDSVFFNDLSTINSGAITQWQWGLGDGNNSFLQNPSHLYSTPGAYIVSLVAISGFGCSDTVSKSLNIQPAPVADFSNSNGCLNSPVLFSDSTTLSSGNIASWYWNFGDGDTSTIQNPFHTYVSAGIFTVELIAVSDSGCSDTLVKQISVSPMPVADFSSNAQCFVDSVFFTDASTISGGNIVSWNWDFGDGAPASSLTDPSHFYSASGVYNISLVVVSDSGCADTITKSISVNPKPDAGFSFSMGCSGSPVFFIDSTTVSSGNIISWSWDFGDGDSASAQNPSHSYASPGTFTVEMIAVSDSGCTDTVIRQISVFPMPAADFTSTAQCFIDSVFFTDISTVSGGNIVSWSWDFGDGAPASSLPDPSHFYSSAGIYNVSLVIVSDSGCTDTISKSVTVNPSPEADFGNSNGCLGVITFFSDSSTISSGNIISWTWNFGDAGSGNGPNPTHLYAGEGVYNVQLIAVSDSGCTDTIVKQVTVYPLPVAGFTNSAQCFVDSVFFTDTSTIASGNISQWLWNFGDGNNSTQQNPSHFYSSLGNYTVSLVVISEFGCSDTISQSIAVAPAPNANFIMSTGTVCINQSILFADISTISSGNIISWSWDFGDGGTASTANVFHSYVTSDTFTIVLTVTSNLGCVDTASLNVIAYPSPAAYFIPDGFCINEGTQFLDSSIASPDTVVSWQWYFGDGSTGFSQNPVHFYPMVGSYGVTLIATTNHGCKDTLTQVITVNPTPTAAFTPDNYVTLTGEPVSFTNTSTGSSAWEWDFGDTSGTSSAQHPEYIYSTGGTFVITLIAENEFSCKDTATDSVIVNIPPKVPNGFSPNGDGKNDLLYPLGGPYKQVEFKIYNNWGELIYLSKNADEGWDGTKNGIPQPIGVYVYMLYAVTEDGNEYNLHGDVTLLR